MAWLRTLLKFGYPFVSQKPNSTIAAVFDNSQLMQRHWRITLTHLTECHVVTQLMFLELNGTEYNTALNIDPISGSGFFHIKLYEMLKTWLRVKK
jgi:hypothetical protein